MYLQLVYDAVYSEQIQFTSINFKAHGRLYSEQNYIDSVKGLFGNFGSLGDR